MKRIDFSRYHTRLTFLCILMVLVIASMVLIFIQSKNKEELNLAEPVAVESIQVPKEPRLTTETIIGGLSHPWDVVFLPDSTLLFNERNGQVSKLVNGQKQVIADISDVYAVGEGGLTGLALDANFKENRYIYTCFNAQTRSGLDVRLVRWKLNGSASALEDRRDIVSGIPGNRSGRHSGCRVRSDTEGNLWVGTGDAAVASHPQDPKSLGGKILHVTRDGMPVGDNLPAPFDPRIFSYGHRNVQGLILFEKPRSDGVYGYSIEHGSNRDDEVNLLKKGNFGWAPRITYIEAGVPMTDTKRFPDAISALWSSGFPTIAPSGGTRLIGEKWGTYDGRVAMAVLKARHVRLLEFNESDQLISQKEVLDQFGRIRSATLGPDGSLYLTTDNGSDDKIVKVLPTY